ncbi:MAG: hypothetical protein ABJA79_07780 [Parafilimonas sp.]
MSKGEDAITKWDCSDAILDFTTRIWQLHRKHILASLFRNERYSKIKSYCASLLSSGNQNGILQDPSIFAYINAMNLFSMNGNISAAIINIDKAISNYKSFGKNCYQGLLNDMSCLKTQLSFLDGKDTIAYEIYKKLYAATRPM